ncbi:hypothetical protein [Polycladomyces subterraneus]|uniref:Uncharacterized protein n=1 Tax=Polycladomyces subterraneus TaxID=1016997 RepID=A0ABT8IRG5_9BACL|nr:hypothetical protein [Polycladomyces subterraneus]MDN4595398.1 hypothetical protein [Polycladomyces subterraneus]
MANDLSHLVIMAKESEQQLLSDIHQIKNDPPIYWHFPSAIGKSKSVKRRQVLWVFL